MANSPKRSSRSSTAGRARVTVRDVARIVGVSPSTVSRVLNNGTRSEFISEETRRRVRQVAQELGYTPSPIAKALRGGSSGLIGLIVHEIADPFFASLIQELSNNARSRGYQIVLGYAHGDPDQALTVSSVLDTRHVDGMIVLGDLTHDELILGAILENVTAAVGLCRGRSSQTLFTINTDNAAGVRILFDHLYGLGHRHIGYLDGGLIGDISERREAFLACMAERGLEVRPAWIREAVDGLAGGYQAMTDLIAQGDLPTALMAADDVIALGAMKAALQHGLRVPEDLSITGFDDIEMAKFMHPGLTTIRQPIDLLSHQAIDSLLEQVAQRPPVSDASMMRFTPTLQVRQSTAQPRTLSGG